MFVDSCEQIKYPHKAKNAFRRDPTNQANRQKRGVLHSLSTTQASRPKTRQDSIDRVGRRRAVASLHRQEKSVRD